MSRRNSDNERAIPAGPLVSVIIPAYNAESTICRAIESISSQSYQCVEIIVVDNGSSDSTREVVSGLLHEDERIRLVEAGRTGVSNARNVGIEASKGDYIVFCDADDEMERGALSHLLEHRSDGEIVAGGVSFDVIDAEGKVVSSFPRRISASVRVRGRELSEHFEVLWARNYLQSCWAKLYSASFIRQTGVRFDESLSSYEDLTFVLDCLSSGARFVAIPDICYRYLRSVSETNSTRYKPDMTDQMQRVAERVVTFYKEVLGRCGDPSCSEHVVRMLTIAVNNALKAEGGICAAERAIADVYSRPVFRDATLSATTYPNRYSYLLVRLGAGKHYVAVALLARLRNWIRSMRVAK